MNHAPLSTVFIALAAGAAGALVATLLRDEPVASDSGAASAQHAQRNSAAGPQPASAADEGWRVALAGLSRDLAGLTERIEQLERRPEPQPRVALAAPAAAEEDAQAQTAVRELAPEQVQESVATALENLRAQERAQAEQQRQQRELERVEERLARLGERLELSPAQTGDLRALMLRQERERDELERLRDEGADREQRRAAAEELRKRTDAEYARILTPAQLESYKKLSSERGGDRGRAGRGANAGGGGRRGG